MVIIVDSLTSQFISAFSRNLLPARRLKRFDIGVGGPCFRTGRERFFFFYLCRQLVDTPVFWMLSCSFVFAWFCLEQIHECSGFCWIHFFLLS